MIQIGVMKERYTLVGVDGNAFAIMGYVLLAMKDEGFSKEERDEYLEDAKSSDYDHLLCVSVEYIDRVNDRVKGF